MSGFYIGLDDGYKLPIKPGDRINTREGECLVVVEDYSRNSCHDCVLYDERREYTMPDGTILCCFNFHCVDFIGSDLAVHVEFLKGGEDVE